MAATRGGQASVPIGYYSEEEEVWMAWQESIAKRAVSGNAYPAAGLDAPT
jgi:hypothetical protein